MFKKYLALLLTFALLATPATATDEIVCGDINDDGVVNSLDALIGLKKVIGVDVPGDQTPDGWEIRGDVDGDVEITINDVFYILMFTVDKVGQLPVDGDPLGNGEYVPHPKNPAVLSAELEERIKEDWGSEYTNPEPQHNVSAVDIRYYGTYSGWVAFYIWDNYHGYPDVMVHWNIDGVIFYNYQHPEIYLWKDGEFFPVGFAYVEELITRKNLIDIAYYYNLET